MAIYHLAAKIISRNKGRSAIAAAAYRAGEIIACERTGLVFDFRRKKEVAYRQIFAPKNSPDWVFDRARLWNEVEMAEKRRDAQLCREVEVALPHELPRKTQIALLQEFIERQFIKEGMVADVALHAKDGNVHAHILLTLRHITPNGFGQKCRSWNTTDQIEKWRIAWESYANRKLSALGSKARLDHRSLKAQGLPYLPTVHEGVNRYLADKGELSFRQELNQLIKENNMKILNTSLPIVVPAGPSPQQAKRKISRLEEQKHREREKKERSKPKLWIKNGKEETELHEKNDAKKRKAYWEQLAELFGYEHLHEKRNEYGDYILIKVNENAAVFDFGSSVGCAHGNDDEVAAAVALAKAKRWETIEVDGDENFRRKVFFEAVKQGFTPDQIIGYVPTEDELREAMEIAKGRGIQKAPPINIGALRPSPEDDTPTRRRFKI